VGTQKVSEKVMTLPGPSENNSILLTQAKHRNLNSRADYVPIFKKIWTDKRERNRLRDTIKVPGYIRNHLNPNQNRFQSQHILGSILNNFAI
jgi:hypothetical protein